MRYDAHLPALSFWNGENLRTILKGMVLTTLHGHVLCKKWNKCRVCWKDCECKNLHVPTPLELATDIAEMLKTAQ